MSYDPYQPGQPRRPPPPPQPPQKPKRKGLRIVLGSVAGLIVLFVIIGVAGSHAKTPAPASTPTATASAAAVASSAPPPSPSPKPVAQTVTYIVTGSDADVTYGPAGTDLSGTVPMSVTQPLGTPAYYDINAQLNGSGDVKCAIEVDGKPVSTAEASGGYNIADCEISQDPLTGKWQDTNSG
jgi:hypothetical protein